VRSASMIILLRYLDLRFGSEKSISVSVKGMSSAQYTQIKPSERIRWAHMLSRMNRGKLSIRGKLNCHQINQV
jgi:hypothetical protein